MDMCNWGLSLLDYEFATSLKCELYADSSCEELPDWPGGRIYGGSL